MNIYRKVPYTPLAHIWYLCLWHIRIVLIGWHRFQHNLQIKIQKSVKTISEVAKYTSIFPGPISLGSIHLNYLVRPSHFSWSIHWLAQTISLSRSSNSTLTWLLWPSLPNLIGFIDPHGSLDLLNSVGCPIGSVCSIALLHKFSCGEIYIVPLLKNRLFYLKWLASTVTCVFGFFHSLLAKPS